MLECVLPVAGRDGKGGGGGGGGGGGKATVFRESLPLPVPGEVRVASVLP